MSFFNDTFCQLCEQFNTEEQWKKNLYSSRRIRTEVNGYWPAFFLQKNLTKDESFMLEKAF